MKRNTFSVVDKPAKGNGKPKGFGKNQHDSHSALLYSARPPRAPINPVILKICRILAGKGEYPVFSPEDLHGMRFITFYPVLDDQLNIVADKFPGWGVLTEEHQQTGVTRITVVNIARLLADNPWLDGGVA